MSQHTRQPASPPGRLFHDVRLAAAASWGVLRSGALFRNTREWRRTWAKARWLALRGLGIQEVVLPFDGRKLVVNTRDYAIGCQVYVDGHFSRDEFQRALALAHEAGLFSGTRPTFIDVGANIGTHTLYALNTGLFSRVLSVEPEADNFRLLRQNLAINGFEVSDAFNAALSNVAGAGLLTVHGDNRGDHRVVRGEPSQGGPTESIELVDFVSLAARAGLDARAPLMFWIDTQGHEYEVLSGVPEARLRSSAFVIEYWAPILKRNGTLASLHALLERVANRFVVLQDGRRLDSVAAVAAIGHNLMSRPVNDAYVDVLCFGSDLGRPRVSD